MSIGKTIKTRKAKEDDITKIIWAILLKTGTLLDPGEEVLKPRKEYEKYLSAYCFKRREYFSYYGGHFISAGKEFKQAILERFLANGIAWDLTEEPYGTTEAEFDGTENDSRDIEVLIGKLFFNDGSYVWIASVNPVASRSIRELLNLAKKYLSSDETVEDILKQFLSK